MVAILIILSVTLFSILCKKATTDNPLLGIYAYNGMPEFKLHLKSFTFANTTHPNNIVAQRYINNQPYESDFIIERWKDGVYRWKFPETNEFTYFTIIGYNPVTIKQDNPEYILTKINQKN